MSRKLHVTEIIFSEKCALQTLSRKSHVTGKTYYSIFFMNSPRFLQKNENFSMQKKVYAQRLFKTSDVHKLISILQLIFDQNTIFELLMLFVQWPQHDKEWLYFDTFRRCKLCHEKVMLDRCFHHVAQRCGYYPCSLDKPGDLTLMQHYDSAFQSLSTSCFEFQDRCDEKTYCCFDQQDIHEHQYDFSPSNVKFGCVSCNVLYLECLRCNHLCQVFSANKVSLPNMIVIYPKQTTTYYLDLKKYPNPQAKQESNLVWHCTSCNFSWNIFKHPEGPNQILACTERKTFLNASAMRKICVPGRHVKYEMTLQSDVYSIRRVVDHNGE